MPHNVARPGDALRRLTAEQRRDIIQMNHRIVTEIAEETGLSTGTVSKVFHGKRKRWANRVVVLAWERRLPELLRNTTMGAK